MNVLLRVSATSVVAAVLTAFTACDGEVVPIAENRGAPDADADRATSVECCPIDDAPSCCMAYGGTKTSDTACAKTCDGMPIPSDPGWVRSKNADGCDGWSNDYSYGASPDPLHDPRLCGAMTADGG